jgi:hypothetical protein|tara:strand:+ start:13134 stop:13292 length:159 start_codon:yes stop_codon:yes gene_type:complete
MILKKNYKSVEYNGDLYKVLVVFGLKNNKLLISKDGKTKKFSINRSDGKKLK